MNAVLKKIICSQKHCEEFVKPDLQSEYFGADSICRHSVTHMACLVANEPLIAWICICANWKMAVVMNGNMRYESVRDEYVGHICLWSS